MSQTWSVLSYRGWQVPIYGTVGGLVLATFHPLAGISIAFAFAASGIIGGGFWFLAYVLQILAATAGLICDLAGYKNIPTR